MNRFFLDADARQGDRIRLCGPAGHQVARVLRMAAGDRLVAVVDGKALLVSLDTIGKDLAEGRVVGQAPSAPPLPVPVTLAQALIKGDKFDWVVQKATELGVHAIRPLVAARSMAIPADERLARRLDRWQAIAREAAEQCERAEVPAILSPARTVELPFEGMALLLDARGGVPLSRASPTEVPSALTVLVGPEGGFDSEEAAVLVARGAVATSMGPRVLRTETAGLAALAVLGHIYER